MKLQSSAKEEDVVLKCSRFHEQPCGWPMHAGASQLFSRIRRNVQIEDIRPAQIFQ